MSNVAIHKLIVPGKSVTLTLIVLTVVVVVTGGFFTVQRHRLNAELDAVRNSLSFPDTWTIVNENRQSPALFGTTCNFGATRCPSISIELSMPSPPRVATDLQLSHPSVRWHSEHEKCEVPENYSNDKAPLCSLTGRIDQWNITVRAASVAERGNLFPPHTVTITIEPSD